MKKLSVIGGYDKVRRAGVAGALARWGGPGVPDPKEREDGGQIITGTAVTFFARDYPTRARPFLHRYNLVTTGCPTPSAMGQGPDTGHRSRRSHDKV